MRIRWPGRSTSLRHRPATPSTALSSLMRLLSNARLLSSSGGGASSIRTNGARSGTRTAAATRKVDTFIALGGVRAGRTPGRDSRNQGSTFPPGRVW
eukprot:3504950-Prymnesium_polylepis.1